MTKLAKLAIAAMQEGRTNRGAVRPDSCKDPQIDLLDKLSELK
ncbi:MAG: hypothetical protein OES84_06305 [Kiritimatiellaceae bacterium]|nr:hypothetical protein [Kiritimatiellaceae bacterium]